MKTKTQNEWKEDLIRITAEIEMMTQMVWDLNDKIKRFNESKRYIEAKIKEIDILKAK